MLTGRAVSGPPFTNVIPLPHHAGEEILPSNNLLVSVSYSADQLVNGTIVINGDDILDATVHPLH